ncbi:Rrf2 family transcriptional regulator [Aquirhabdus sp.]|uniref:Rrf2 family transcriptional regulator n=1 Tax=Aquirhabdus sp. TaxID=2824160 RepID=UPI00396C79BA
MRLTTRGRYAVTAMLDLTLQQSSEQQPITLAEIADRQSISIAYLEQLFSKLKRQGLVASSRGALGGYRLAKPSHEIAILDIIEAVNESVDATACEGQGNCRKGAKCLTHDLWHELSMQIENYLAGVTLADLVDRADSQNGIKSGVHVITGLIPHAQQSSVPSL